MTEYDHCSRYCFFCDRHDPHSWEQQQDDWNYEMERFDVEWNPEIVF